MSLIPEAETITDDLLLKLASTLFRSAMAASRRLILGIAGIGGAGKSTLAARLLAAVNDASTRSQRTIRVAGAEGSAQAPERLTRDVRSGASADSSPGHPEMFPGSGRGQEKELAVLVPMDGFHFSNARLEQLNRRQRKGAPDTFDVDGYLALLRRLREEPQSKHGNRDVSIPFPVYDRDLHEPVLRPGQHAVAAHHRIVITEGNYLLLDESPWSQLADLLDVCWFLDTTLEQSREWILARHIRGGRSPQDAAAHYERCDLANARLVHEKMRRPDRVLWWAINPESQI